MIHKFVLHNLVQVGSSLRISRQDSSNQIASSIRNVDMIRERVTILTNTPVRGFDIGGLERRFSYDQGVDNDTQRPNIYFIGMTTFALKYFWCDVIGSAADCSLLFTIEIEFSRQSEIAQFDFHFIVKE